MNRAVRFWTTALFAAAVVAGGVALLLATGAWEGGDAAGTRRRWLLGVWTVGVLAILFGLGGVIGGLSGIGVREIVEAGSLVQAHQQERARRRALAEGGIYNSFAWWTVCTGLLLVGLYFVGWLALE